MNVQPKTDHRAAHVIGMQVRTRRRGFPLPNHPEATFQLEIAKTPSSRARRRQRGADFRSTQKKQARKAFQETQQAQRTVHLLTTWGRIYLEGAGNPEIRSNVTQAVHQQAWAYAETHDEAFETSRKRLEEAMLGAITHTKAKAA